MERARYCKWLSVLCLVMALFGVGVMLIGYKAPTVGLVGTVVVLMAAAALLAARARMFMRSGGARSHR